MHRLLIMVAALALVAGCGKEERKPEAHAPVEVTAITVTPRDTPVSFEYVGQSQSSHQVQIRARVDGFLHWLDSRGAVPTIRALRHHAETLRQSELERAVRLLAKSGGKEWETFGVDPDSARGQVREAFAIISRWLAPPTTKRDDDAMTSLIQTVAEFVAYFDGITADRKATPTDDLASVIANGIIEGEPIGHKEQLGYYIIAATAGHDTTSNAMAGGMKALLDHPDQLARLQADPSLMPTAIDEMIRWSSPVKHFMRTATVDYDIRGTTVQAGQDVLLSYWSANRDEDVFTDPFRFDVTRAPNRHLAFGHGSHFCLGSRLARLEIAAIVDSLLDRVEPPEQLGPIEWTRSNKHTGVRHLPVRMVARR